MRMREEMISDGLMLRIQFDQLPYLRREGGPAGERDPDRFKTELPICWFPLQIRTQVHEPASGVRQSLGVTAATLT